MARKTSFCSSLTLGIVFPIMLNNLIVTHGFQKAVQYSAALITGCLALSCALMHPRLPVRKGAPKPTPKELFSSKPYALVVAGLFLVAWGLFFPLFYLQVSRRRDHWMLTCRSLARLIICRLL